MKRQAIVSACAAVVAAVTASFPSSSFAATIYWQGGDGAITAANYSLDGPTVIDGNDNLAPVAGDLVRFGATGTGTLSGASASFGTFWVGHNETVLPSTTNNSAVTIDNGATLSLTLGASGSPNAGLIVGHTRGGTLNIDGAATTVTSNQLVVIGFGNNISRAGTINITNGATLNVTAGNINMGDSATNTQNGIQGHLNVNGNVNVLGSGADITLGVRKSTSTITQTGGLIQVADQIEVGFGGNGIIPASANSTYTITGGTTTTGVTGTGNFWIGRAASTGATLNLSGTGTLNVGNRLIMGSETATGATVNHSAGALNVDLDLRIADTFTAAASDATYNLSGTGVITASGTAKTVVGRRGTGRFLQTGGSATLGGTLSIGDQESAAVDAVAADGLYSISAGSLTATGLSVATDGKGEFRVIGDDGTIDINGAFANGNTADGLGTLAFQLDAGDVGLSLVDVSGAATFAAGSALSLNFGTETTSQTSFNLLTATSITDSGLVFSGPAGWSYQIVAGGNGQILQAFTAATGGTLYWDIDGATPGSGGATPSGNWDGTTANFTADAEGDGSTPTAVTTANDDVVFSAGTDSTGSYTVTVSGTQSAKSVAVARGSVSFTGGTIATNTVDVAAGASAAVSSAVNSTTGLTKTGSGPLTLSSANTYTGGTTVAAGTLVAAHANAIGTGQALTVNDGATMRSQSGVTTALDVSGLTLAPTAKLDLNDGGLVKRNASGAAGQTATQQATAALKTGLENGGNFDWLGNGISSTEAAADNATAGSVLFGLGVVQNNLASAGSPDGTTTDETAGNTIYTTFKGRTVGLNDTLVRYTYMGDADLSGNIDGTDYSLIDAGFGAGLKGWINGDFDYSGSIDGTDYALIDNAFGAQTGVLPEAVQAMIAQHTALFGQSYVDALAAVQSGVVPEPATMGVLALSGVGLLARRRRNR